MLLLVGKRPLGGNILCESAHQTIDGHGSCPGLDSFLSDDFLSRAFIGRLASFDLQQFEQFGAGHQQLAAQGTTRLQFPALNQPVNTEIVDTKHGCGFLDGIRQPFGSGR